LLLWLELSNGWQVATMCRVCDQPFTGAAGFAARNRNDLIEELKRSDPVESEEIMAAASPEDKAAVGSVSLGTKYTR